MNGSAVREPQSPAFLRNLAKSSRLIDEETERNLSPKLVGGRAGSGAHVSSVGTFYPKTLVVILEVHKCHIKVGALAPKLAV